MVSRWVHRSLKIKTTLLVLSLTAQGPGLLNVKKEINGLILAVQWPCDKLVALICLATKFRAYTYCQALKLQRGSTLL